MSARMCWSSAIKDVWKPGQRVRQVWAVALTILLLLVATGLSASADPASLVRHADALMVEHKFERACSAYEQAMAEGARFDDDLQHARNLGIAYLNSAPPDLAKSIHWFRVTLALDSQDDGVRAELAKALLRSGDAAGAIENYRILINHTPQSADSVIGLAAALRQAGNTEAALQLFQTTTQLFPALVPVRIEYARLLNFTRQFVEAKRQFSAVLAVDSSNLIAQVGLAKATSFDGDQEGAISMYDRVLQRHPGLYDAMVGKAFSLLWSGHLDQARPLLEEAARRQPDDREVQEALAQALSSKAAGTARVAPSTGGQTAARIRPGKLQSPTPTTVTPETPRTLGIRTVPPVQPPTSRAKLISPTRSRLLFLAASLAALASLWVFGRVVFRPKAAASRHSSLTRPVQFLRTWVGAGDDERQKHNEIVSESPGPPAEAGRHGEIANSGTEGDRKATPEPGFMSTPGNSTPFAMRPEVLVVGGSTSIRELECRWLAAEKVETAVESDWSQAVIRLSSASPDLIVLNAITSDGWTSTRMFNWIAANRPKLRSQCLVIVSTGKAAEQVSSNPEVHYLFDPFDSREWHQAIVEVLPLHTAHEVRGSKGVTESFGVHPLVPPC